MGKRKWLIVIIIAAAVVLVMALWRPWEHHHEDMSQYRQTETEPETVQNSESETVSETVAYVSPIDFDSLKAVNEDIYAWLEIPGTDISYPILQHPTEDEYYLRRDYKGNHAIAGCLFTEHSYNSTTMEDPMTVIYGHDMDNGEMLGSLQTIYSDEESLKEHQEIIIYLPDKELHYTVFAAVPFDKTHILYNYDFSKQRVANIFYQDILSTRALGACIDQKAYKGADTNSIILSTCLKGNNQKRFLVAAQCNNDNK